MEKQKTIPQSEKDGQETEQKIAKAKTALQEFRQNLYKYFSHRADAIIELIDARVHSSVVEKSLQIGYKP